MGAMVSSGQFDTLFPPASIDNGRSLLAWDDIIKINMPRVFSQFYEDAILSERPVVTGDDTVIAWLAEYGMQVWERIGRAVQQWSIFGLGVMVSYQDGTLRHIGSPNYFRVGDFVDDDLQVGHVIAYPYAELSASQSNNPGALRPPNRLRIIRYMSTENINDVTTYGFQGSAPDGYGGVVQGIIEPTRPAGITHLATFGYNDSWYADAKDLMARLMLRLSLGDRELNRFLNRITLVPQGILSDLKGRGDTRSPTEVYQGFTMHSEPDAGARPKREWGDRPSARRPIHRGNGPDGGANRQPSDDDNWCPSKRSRDRYITGRIRDGQGQGPRPRKGPCFSPTPSPGPCHTLADSRHGRTDRGDNRGLAGYPIRGYDG